MSSMVIAMGATIFQTKPKNLKDLEEVVEAIAPAMGTFWSKIILSVGFFGSSMVASIVVSITPAWAVCELAGVERSLNKPWSEARGFYTCFLAILFLSYVVTNFPEVGDSAYFNVQVEILNAFLMPGIVLLLFLLANNPRVLPPEIRLQGWYRIYVATIFMVCSAVCAYACSQDLLKLMSGSEHHFFHLRKKFHGAHFTQVAAGPALTEQSV